MFSEEYPSYEVREKAKQEGWKKIAESVSPREKAFHFLYRIIWSHYWRAREDIENRRYHKTFLKKIRGKKYYSGYVLDIDHYTPHWMHANRERLDQNVLDLIKDEFHYEPEKCKFLPDGCTSYQFVNPPEAL